MYDGEDKLMMVFLIDGVKHFVCKPYPPISMYVKNKLYFYDTIEEIDIKEIRDYLGEHQCRQSKYKT